MTADVVKATMFAYQVGFGDCFLLRFEYSDGVRRHMLIDFGTVALPDGLAPDHMLRVARDIAAKCGEPGGSGLDVVVGTHRHADHISGFATGSGGSGPGDVIAGLKPKLVIQPWTEAPDAPLDWEGPAGVDRATSFASHRDRLTGIHRTAEAALGFLERAGRGVPKAVAEQIAFIGEDNLSNASAVRNLQSMAQRREYVFHGCDLDLSVELPGVKADVLGPPTLKQTETIRKQRSRDRDEFWQLSAKRMEEMAAGDDAAPLFPGAPTVPGNKMMTEYRWLQRRLDACNAELVLGLVRALDRQMNNTSVILVLRVGGRTLLLPGDAQIENWAFALGTPLAALLDDVDLYKVGHHGSLNATPKSMWARFRKRSRADGPDRLTSVVSTKKGKHGSVASNTEVPRRTLISALDAETSFHTTEALDPDQLCEIIEIPLQQGAAAPTAKPARKRPAPRGRRP